MNPKTETVEELRNRRKNLHMGMLKLAREDLALRLQAELDSFEVLIDTRKNCILYASVLTPSTSLS